MSLIKNWANGEKQLEHFNNDAAEAEYAAHINRECFDNCPHCEADYYRWCEFHTHNLFDFEKDDNK